MFTIHYDRKRDLLVINYPSPKFFACGMQEFCFGLESLEFLGSADFLDYYRANDCVRTIFKYYSITKTLCLRAFRAKKGPGKKRKIELGVKRSKLDREFFVWFAEF